MDIYDYPDGIVDIRYQGLPLPFSVFDKVSHIKQGDIVSNRRLGSVLEFAKEMQKEIGYERSQKGPSRRGQKAARKANPAV